MYKHEFNRTKIISTIGPASHDYEILKEMVYCGMDVCRLNFSHGTHEDHLFALRNIRKLNEEINSNICILQDLQGPKLRVGDMGEGIELITDQLIKVTNTPIVSNSEIVHVIYEALVEEVKPGECILLDDGNLELKVIEKIDDHTLLAKIVNGGLLKSNKGFNLPQSKLSVPSLTEKDITDLAFGIEHGVEWIGLSFVRSAKDIIELKKRIKDGGSSARVVAKIEKPEAVRGGGQTHQSTLTGPPTPKKLERSLSGSRDIPRPSRRG